MPAAGRQGGGCGSVYPVQVRLLLGPAQEWTRNEKRTSQPRRYRVGGQYPVGWTGGYQWLLLSAGRPEW